MKLAFALVALVELGSVAAADVPKKASSTTTAPTEVELTAPWDKLDLSSHDETKIYASVGAKKQKQPTCDQQAALTDGICWTTYPGVGRWRAGLATKNETARKKLLDAWGPGEVRDEGDQKSTYWLLRAGEHHYIAYWNGSTEYGIEISELTSLKQVIENAKGFVGKTRDDVMQMAGVSATFCEPGRPSCELDYSVNEIATVTTQVTLVLDSGPAAKSVAVKFMVPGVSAAAVQARIESALGKATVRSCKISGAASKQLTFKSSAATVVWFAAKNPREVQMCFGACDAVCK